MAVPLLVPRGTSMQKLAQVQLTFVDNGVIMSKVFVIEEADRPPAQLQTSLVFVDIKDALANILGDVS